MIDTRAVLRVIVRAAALDVSFIVAGVIAWSTIDCVDPRVLAAAYLARALLVLLHLWHLLTPVRQLGAAGVAASDELLLAADDALQHRVHRFYLSYPLSYVVAIGLSFAITVAVPSFGVVAGNAERLTVALGAVTCAILCYAFMLALLSAMTRELVAEVSSALQARGLAPRRAPRSVTQELRWFLTALVVGLLLVATVIGGKVRSDAIRQRTIVDQTSRAALAVADLRAGLERLEDLEEGLSVVSVDELPAVLDRSGVRGAEARTVGAVDAGRGRVVAAVALGDGRWVLAEGAPDEQLPLFVTLMAIVTAIMGAVAYVSAVAIGHGLTRPIADLRAATQTLVETGALHDLSRAAPHHNDEIGALVQDFDALLDMLDELAAVARGVSTGDLRVDIDRPGELQDAFRAMVAQLHQMVDRLRSTTIDVTSATSEIQASMRAHERAAAKLSKELELALDDTQTLAVTAGDIRVNSSQVLAFAERSATTSDAIAGRFTALDQQVANITELLGVIADIADRSDLLALNGALEATRAGEAGRGFALVAAEMRRLAERVTAAVDHMSALIREIQLASTSAGQVMDQGRALAAETANAAREITTLTARQSEGATRATTATVAMNEFMTETSAGVTQIGAAAEGLRDRVTHLEQLTRAFVLRTDLPDSDPLNGGHEPRPGAARTPSARGPS